MTRPLKLPAGAVAFQTRALLGGAYRGNRADDYARALAHLVFLDASGSELSGGCCTVKPGEDTVDPLGHTVEQLAERPDCPACGAKWDRATEAQRAANAVFAAAQREG